ncbi:hypothetical protein [Nitrospina watsonii]|uniref:DUF1570 domain-containing protein n=1 Tax=Nitrospina watsonii TaxID=1323948 RepID=A0ABM9HFE7_9BACT|nr:hypothetical protein [Nitrospina watsonii]CAI2718999.1 conserved exported protein of unknown function [Nitrospina watsonii]
MRTVPFKVRVGIGVCLLLVWAAVAAAQPPVGVGELNSLIDPHRPKPDPTGRVDRLQSFEMQLPLGDSDALTTFLIPGFQNYECGRCHQPAEIVEKAQARMQWALTRLKEMMPEVREIPIRQYIIQPYADALLQEGQLAHATFDTIRISPASILIDEKAYGRATHLHEVLHLSQPFLGHVNELEAYGLNVRSDPRFLLLNYPYFEDVMRAFFVPELDEILNAYFERSTRDKLNVPREVQWFLSDFDEDVLNRLATGVQSMTPVLEAASRLYRAHPLEAAYWSERTGIRSFLLDVAAVRTLTLPEAPVSGKAFQQAMDIFDLQMTKDDNTRLGYIIDRKNEAQMHLKHGMNIKDSSQRSILYFHYLKRRFLGTADEVDLSVPEAAREDFLNFVQAKLGGIEKMMELPGMTAVEKQAGRKLVDAIKQKSPR